MDAAIELRRDARVISLIGAGHAVSHFYQLVLPPLFPLMHGDGYSYLQLGLITSTMYLVSAILQPFAGILVDRLGARMLLLLGMTVMAAGTFLYAVAPGYEFLIAAAVLLGVGNSVFHPCDYAVLSATVSEGRMGRAFGLHIFGGYVGYFIAPVLMTTLGAVFGWRDTVMIAAIGGFVFVPVIALLSGEFQDSRDQARTAAKAAPGLSLRDTLSVLFQAPILLSWLFFMVMALGQIGLQSNTVAILSLPGEEAISTSLAGWVVSIMIGATAAGLVYGGYVADRTQRHGHVVSVSYGTAALLMFILTLYPLPPVALFVVFIVTGFSYGVAFPSRDLVVRSTAPPGSTGKVFGFVYAGMDVGSMTAPALFGWFIDAGAPRMAFLCVASLWFLGLLLIRLTASMSTRAQRATAA